MSQRGADSQHTRGRVAIVASRYNTSVTGPMLRAAVELCAQRTGAEPDIFLAPGAYELPALALVAAATGRYEGVCALGCLIRGETRHDRYIAGAVAHGLVGVTLGTGVPVAFGVLTVDNAKQARARSGGRKGNKGAEAMSALLDAIGTARSIEVGDALDADQALAAMDHAPDKSRRALSSAAKAPARRTKPRPLAGAARHG